MKKTRILILVFILGMIACNKDDDSFIKNVHPQNPDTIQGEVPYICDTIPICTIFYF